MTDEVTPLELFAARPLASRAGRVYFSRVQGRLLLSCVLALAACRDSRGPAGESDAAFAAAYGQDPIALRIARGGGPLRAYLYPRLDSVIWTSTQPVSGQSRVLTFDPENGLEAFVDRNGVPGWVDLRVGSVRPGRAPRLSLPASADAWSVFGVARDTVVHRSTPSGEWEYPTSLPVRGLFPIPDGGLVVLMAAEADAMLLRLRPPERSVADSARLPTPNQAVMSPLGDRLYLAYGREVAALNAQTFDETARVTFDSPVIALTTTPSGDRLFVATEGSNRVTILDRYSGEHSEEVRLPGHARDLRMDPFGRLLLVQPDSGDSVWVVNVGTNRVIATLPTEWRRDLPNVAPEGSVATVPGRDVHFTMPGQAKPRIIVRDGGSETWHFVFWNGFRPRAPGLDQPVVFPVDTVAFESPVREAAPAPPPPRVDTVASRPAAAPVDSTRLAPAPQWTVQVAAVLSEERAREIARSTRVEGTSARVVVSAADGARIFRVVLGPFASKVEADRIGRLSGRNYWVFEGVP